MSKYLFKWKADLFDINTLEMDKGLVRFFEDIESLDEPLEFTNEENTIWKFKVNLTEKTISGRGLKGFFKSYESNCLFIERSSDKKIKVSSLPIANTNVVKNLISNPEAAERTEDVLKAMNNMKQSSEIWYQLYDLAQDFQFDIHRGTLICLPHLRELEVYDYQVKTVKSVMHRLKGRAFYVMK
ncbi:hypothetical protein [Alkalihalobacillus sp. BA299]|uniref:hypothetical protein n=1 Tax=Alkalihalobacillus sp. BA299 TaxID=2815938 RepID=UPI001FFDFC93|nr:hypothetical protein [Alkalihalobacillus sp. BA299]